jgi:hypothetical protein
VSGGMCRSALLTGISVSWAMARRIYGDHQNCNVSLITVLRCINISKRNHDNFSQIGKELLMIL